MNLNFFNNKRKVLIFIIILVWLVVLFSFSIYKLSDAPEICYSTSIDPSTGVISGGGCFPTYSSVIPELILPIIIWAIVLIAILIITKIIFRKLN